MLYLDYKAKPINVYGKKIGYQLVPKLRATKPSAAVFAGGCEYEGVFDGIEVAEGIGWRGGWDEDGIGLEVARRNCGWGLADAAQEADAGGKGGLRRGRNGGRGGPRQICRGPHIVGSGCEGDKNEHGGVADFGRGWG